MHDPSSHLANLMLTNQERALTDAEILEAGRFLDSIGFDAVKAQAGNRRERREQAKLVRQITRRAARLSAGR